MQLRGLLNGKVACGACALTFSCPDLQGAGRCPPAGSAGRGGGECGGALPAAGGRGAARGGGGRAGASGPTRQQRCDRWGCTQLHPTALTTWRGNLPQLLRVGAHLLAKRAATPAAAPPLQVPLLAIRRVQRSGRLACAGWPSGSTTSKTWASGGASCSGRMSSRY